MLNYMHIYTHTNQLSLLQNITLNGVLRSNCLGDGFYESLLESGVKPPSQSSLLFPTSYNEWRGSLTGFDSYRHCVLFFCESVVCLIDVIPSACEVTNRSWHHKEIALLSQSLCLNFKLLQLSQCCQQHRSATV